MSPAPFDDCSLWKGNKSSIVLLLDDLAPSGSQPHLWQCTPLTVVIFYIVLFGSIQATYGQICEKYKQYTTKRYGCTRVVFDGYDAPAQRIQSTVAVSPLPEKFS